MITLPALLGDFWSSILAYVFFYPLLMSCIWMLGAIVFYLRFERHTQSNVSLPPEREHYPLVAILIPCFNEAAHADETISALFDLKYPNYQVIAINDGSKDNTGELLNQLAVRFPNLRVIHQIENQGKAVALNTAALLTSADILLGIDGDAYLDPYSLHWLVRHFDEPNVAAVTGNPRVRNRSTLLGRIQVGEFSSIVGLIKRAQRSAGMMFTVSGVVTAFRRSALDEVGYWSPEKLTEDVDVSWKLQLAGWELRFEPHALCWILMPETFKGLWNQRLRWSMGGTQVLLDYATTILSLKNVKLWPLAIEYFMSTLWAYLFAMLTIYRLLDVILFKIDLQSVAILQLGWTGLLIGTTCLLQILLSSWLDRHYDRGLLKNYFWMIWYPLIYWMITSAVAVVAIPRIFLRDTKERARWTSPDRGITPDSH